MIRIEKDEFDRFCNNCRNENNEQTYSVFIGLHSYSGQVVNLCEKCLRVLESRIRDLRDKNRYEF